MALRSGYYGLKKSLLNKVKGLPGIKSIGSGLSLNSTTGELTATGATVAIEANPEGAATDNLLKLGIGEDIYAVPDADKTYQTDDATESAIVDADYIPFLDSSAASGAGAPKKATWSNFISKIKAKITEYVTWEANAKTGAINLAHNEAVNGSGSNVTWTVNEDTKEITISSNNSSAPVFISLGDYIYHALPEGTYKLSDNVGSDDLYTYVARKKGASGTADTSLMTNNSNHEVTFTVDYSQYDYFKIVIVVNSAKTFSNKVAKVMIAPIDYNGDYVAPAMTNKELTDKVQGIINAASNAADFAAFKTAIGNL